MEVLALSGILEIDVSRGQSALSDIDALQKEVQNSGQAMAAGMTGSFNIVEQAAQELDSAVSNAVSSIGTSFNTALNPETALSGIQSIDTAVSGLSENVSASAAKMGEALSTSANTGSAAFNTALEAMIAGSDTTKGAITALADESGVSFRTAMDSVIQAADAMGVDVSGVAEQIRADFASAGQDAGEGLGAGLQAGAEAAVGAGEEIAGAAAKVAEGMGAIAPATSGAGAAVLTLSEQILANANTLAGWEETLATNSARIGELKTELSGMSASEKETGEAAKQLQADLNGLVTANTELKENYSQLEAELKRMVEAQKLVDKSMADAEAESAKLAKSVTSLKDKMKEGGDTISGFGTTLTKVFSPLTILGGLALAASSDINAAMREIRVGTGATGEELKGFQTIFRTVFSSLPDSAHDVAHAIGELNDLTDATGITLQNMAVQQLNLARITGDSLKPQIEATVKAFNNWQISTKDQTNALDFLFKVSQSTGTSVTTLAQQVGQGGAAMRAAGISFQQGAALMGQLDKAGLNSTGIIQALTIALRKIAEKGGDADPSAVLSSIIEKIKSAGTTAEANSIAVGLFGRSAIGMGDAIRSGKLNVDDFLKSLQGSTETINNVSDETRSFGETMKILKNQVELALQPLGGAMTKVMKDLVPFIKDAIGWLTKMAEWFASIDPASQKFIAALVLAGGAIGPFVLAVGKGITALATLSGPAGILLAIAAFAALVISGDNAASGLANMWNKMTGDTAQASAEMVSKISMVTDALRVASLAYIGFRLGGPVGAGIGAAVGIATLPKNETSPMNTTLPQAGSMSKSPQDAVDEFNKNLLAKQKGFWNSAAKEMHNSGRAAGQATMEGVATGQAENVAKPNAAATKFLADLGEKGKKGGGSAGGGMAKALVDSFSDGLTGLQAAVTKVDSSNLGVLFDKLAKNSKAGAEEIKNALKVVVAAVNEFVSAQGVSAKVNEAQFATMDAPIRQALERQTLAYRTAHAEIDRILVEGVAKQKIQIGVTQEMYDKMSVSVKKAFTDMGGAFYILPPKVKDFSAVTKEETAVASKAIADMASSSQKSFDAFVAGLNRVAVEAPKPFQDASIAIIAAAENIHKALAADESLTVIKAHLDIKNSIESTISILEDYGKELGLTGDALDEYVARTVRALPEFAGAHESAVNRVLEAHAKAKIQLPAMWEKIFADLDSTAKSRVASIFGVIATLPGKVGDALRKTQSEIEKWMAFLDSALGLLHKIFGEGFPATIGDALSKIVGLFKGNSQAVVGIADMTASQVGKTAKAAAQDTGTIATAASKMGNTGKEAFSAMAGAAASFTTALGVTAATGSKTMGVISSLFTSTLAGIQAGMAFGPIGGAIVGGVSLIGGILGSLFGGPSGAEKARIEQTKKLELDKLKQDVQKGAIDVVTAATGAFQKALEFFDKLDDFTPTRKKLFAKFFGQLTELMNGFVALTKVWGKQSLIDAKELGEAIGPVMDAISAALDVFDLLVLFVPPKAVVIAALGLALNLLLSAFIAVMEDFETKTIKRSRKFADRIKSVVDVLSAAIAGFGDINNVADIPETAIRALVHSLQIAIAAMEIAVNELDSGGVKRASRLADRARTIVDLIASAIQPFHDIEGIKDVPAAQIKILVTAVRLALDLFNLMMADLDAAATTESSKKAEASKGITEMIGAVIDPFIRVADLKEVPQFGIRIMVESIRAAIIAFDSGLAGISTELIANASKRAEYTKAISDAIGSAAQAFVAVAQLEGANYPFLIQGAIDYMREAVDIFIKDTATLDQQALAAAGNTANTIKTILSAAQDAANVAKTLADAKGATIYNVTEVVGAFGLLFDLVYKESQEITPEMRAAVLLLASAMKSVLDVLAYTLQTFSQVATFTGLPAEALNLIMEGFDRALELLQGLLDRAIQAKSIAEQIRDAMHDAAAALKVAVGDSDTIITTTGAAPPGDGSGAGSAPPPSSKATGSVSGSNVANKNAPSSAATNAATSTTVHNHYYLGDTHFDTSIEQVQSLKGVEKLIEQQKGLEAEQRGRRYNTRNS